MALVRKTGEIITDPADATYPNLEAAYEDLVNTIRSGESSRLRMARIIDAISRQQLYRELGYDSFKAYLPKLTETTSEIGWKSGTSVRRWLAFYNLYVKQLNVDNDTAIRSASHLHTLYTIAALDKDQILSDDPDDGKLGPVEFEDIAKLVLFFTSLPREVRIEGASAEQIERLLSEQGLSHTVQTYKDIVGIAPALPPGGWKLSHTQNIVDAVKAKDADEEDDSAQYERVWVGEKTFDGLVVILRLEVRTKEGVPEDSIPINKEYTPKALKRLIKKDKKEISGE